MSYLSFASAGFVLPATGLVFLHSGDDRFAIMGAWIVLVFGTFAALVWANIDMCKRCSEQLRVALMALLTPTVITWGAALLVPQILKPVAVYHETLIDIRLLGTCVVIGGVVHLIGAALGEYDGVFE